MKNEEEATELLIGRFAKTNRRRHQNATLFLHIAILAPGSPILEFEATEQKKTQKEELPAPHDKTEAAKWVFSSPRSTQR